MNYKQQYARELKRLRTYETKLLNKGLILTKPIIPARPNRITKASVNRLKKITYEKVLSSVEAISRSGEIVSGLEWREEEKAARRLKKKADQTLAEKKREEEQAYISKERLAHIAIDNFRSAFSAFPSKVSESFMLILNAYIENFGELKVGFAMTRMKDKISDYVNRFYANYKKALADFETEIGSLIEEYPIDDDRVDQAIRSIQQEMEREDADW